MQSPDTTPKTKAEWDAWMARTTAAASLEYHGGDVRAAIADLRSQAASAGCVNPGVLVAAADAVARQEV